MVGLARRKRISLLTAALFAICIYAACPQSGKIGVSAFLEASWVFPLGFAVYPGAELSVYSMDLTDRITLDLGITGAGQVAYAKRDIPKNDFWSFISFGAAVAPLARLSFDDGSPDTYKFIERLSFSLSPGVGFNYYIYDGDPAYTEVRDIYDLDFVVLAGFGLRIARFISLRFDTTYWGQYIGPNIAAGVQLELF